MALSDIRIPQAVIKFSGGEFPVRGLNVTDLTELIQTHGKEITSVYDRFIDSGTDLTPEDVMGFVMPLIQTFPEMVSTVIALAADDPESTDVVRKLPFTVQADALEQVIVLTFDAEGGPKKFVETVVRLLQGTTGLLTSLKA